MPSSKIMKEVFLNITTELKSAIVDEFGEDQGIIIYDKLYTDLGFEINPAFNFVNPLEFNGKFKVIIGILAPILIPTNPFRLDDRVIKDSETWKYYDSVSQTLKVGTSFSPQKTTTWGGLTKLGLTIGLIMGLAFLVSKLGDTESKMMDRVKSRLLGRPGYLNLLKTINTAVSAIKTTSDTMGPKVDTMHSQIQNIYDMHEANTGMFELWMLYLSNPYAAARPLGSPSFVSPSEA